MDDVILKINASKRRRQYFKGRMIILAAFGGGFTWGATLVRWEY